MVKQRVLLTGSAGFVGRSFLQWFNERPDAYVVDTVDIAHQTVLGNGRSWHMDVREWFAAASGVAALRYDLVVHLAAVVGGRATIDGQPMAVATDLAIDADMWQYVLRTKPRQVAYFSSSAAYPTRLQAGNGGVGPRERRLRENDIDLDHIEHPDAIYGLVKLVGEQQARHVAQALPDTQVLVLRPFSGFGVGQSGDYPAPSIIGRAHRRENPLTLWSDAVRDFVDIRDVVRVTMTALERGHAGPLNICTGNPLSFMQFARIAANLVGYIPEIRVSPGMPTGVAYRVGDPARMLEVMGDERPFLITGVSSTIAAMLMRLDGRA